MELLLVVKIILKRPARRGCTMRKWCWPPPAAASGVASVPASLAYVAIQLPVKGKTITLNYQFISSHLRLCNVVTLFN